MVENGCRKYGAPALLHIKETPVTTKSILAVTSTVLLWHPLYMSSYI